MKKNKTCGCACGGTQKTLLKPADALMAVAILAISSDGKLDDRELSLLERATASNKLFSGVKKPRDYMGCIAAAIVDKGRDAVLAEAAALLSPSLREAAYAWAVCMVSADGKTVPPEHRFLSVLRREMKLHGVLAGKINAVIPMLNRSK